MAARTLALVDAGGRWARVPGCFPIHDNIIFQYNDNDIVMLYYSSPRDILYSRTNFSFAPNHYRWAARAPHNFAANDGVDYDSDTAKSNLPLSQPNPDCRTNICHSNLLAQSNLPLSLQLSRQLARNVATPPGTVPEQVPPAEPAAEAHTHSS